MIQFLYELLVALFPRPNHTEPIELNPMNVVPKNLLESFCLAIRDYEGPPGDLNYQNNNPGNCRCSSVGYAPMYGNVLCVNTKSGHFAKFPSYALGWLYLHNLVKEKVHTHPTWTIEDFFHNYSPSSDGNDPSHYAIFVAKRCGVLPTAVVSSLF